jgi:hypothetical protein
VPKVGAAQYPGSHDRARICARCRIWKAALRAMNNSKIVKF